MSALAFLAVFSRDAFDITPTAILPVGVFLEDAAPVPATYRLWLAAVGTSIWVRIGVTGNATVAVAGPISRAADTPAAMRIRGAAMVFATMLALKAANGFIAARDSVKNAEFARIVFITLVADELAVFFLAGVAWKASLAGAAATFWILDIQILQPTSAAPRVVPLLVVLAIAFAIPIALVLVLVATFFLFLFGSPALASGAECEARHERTH